MKNTPTFAGQRASRRPRTLTLTEMLVGRLVDVLELLLLGIGVLRIALPILAKHGYLGCNVWLVTGASVWLAADPAQSFTLEPAVLASLRTPQLWVLSFLLAGCCLVAVFLQNKTVPLSIRTAVPVLLVVLATCELLIGVGLRFFEGGWILEPTELVHLFSGPTGKAVVLLQSITLAAWLNISAALLSGDLFPAASIAQVSLSAVMMEPWSKDGWEAAWALSRVVLALLCTAASTTNHIGYSTVPAWAVVPAVLVPVLVVSLVEFCRSEPYASPPASTFPILLDTQPTHSLPRVSSSLCWLLNAAFWLVLALIATFTLVLGSRLVPELVQGGEGDWFACLARRAPDEVDPGAVRWTTLVLCVVVACLMLVVVINTIHNLEHQRSLAWNGRLQGLNDALASFLKYNAHEVRVPMTVIQLGLESLKAAIHDLDGTSINKKPGMHSEHLGFSNALASINWDSASPRQFGGRSPRSSSLDSGERPMAEALSIVNELQLSVERAKSILSDTIEFEAMTRDERAALSSESGLPPPALQQGISLTLRVGWVPIESIIASLSMMTRPSARSAGINLLWSMSFSDMPSTFLPTTSRPSAPPTVNPAAPITSWSILVDQCRLEQAVLNIVSNAVKFVPRKGNVKVSLSLVCDSTDSAPQELPCRLHIAIQDDGPGMDEEQVASLFRPFRPVQTSKGEPGTAAQRFKLSGSGLGLVSEGMVLMRRRVMA
jgi:signal transduction histidine kinase